MINRKDTTKILKYLMNEVLSVMINLNYTILFSFLLAYQY